MKTVYFIFTLLFIFSLNNCVFSQKITTLKKDQKPDWYVTKIPKSDIIFGIGTGTSMDRMMAIEMSKNRAQANVAEQVAKINIEITKKIDTVVQGNQTFINYMQQVNTVISTTLKGLVVKETAVYYDDQNKVTAYSLIEYPVVNYKKTIMDKFNENADLVKKLKECGLYDELLKLFVK